MNDAATSLDRLHDIVQPPPVPWWPPAPGWYFVIALLVVAAVWLIVQAWKQWQANAYRREALRELKVANTPVEIAELLRRAALAIAPRSTIAALSDESWTDWLASVFPDRMPQPVKQQLAGAIYESKTKHTDTAELKTFAKRWIERHHAPKTA